ncbi:DMT family transporter [Anaerotignum faecicola]|nr:DMT family transporter [Anaerotignum faecicola]
MGENGKRKNALICMVACGLCWSTSSLMIKLCPWGSFHVAAARGLLAGLFLLGYIYFVRRKKFVFTKTAAFVSVFVCFKYIGFITANKLAAGANCAAILQASSVFVLLAGCIIDKKLPRGRDVAVIAAVAAGIVLFFYGQFDISSVKGNLAALLSAFCTAVMFYGSGRFDTVEENLSAIIMGNFLSAALSLAFLGGTPFEITPRAVCAILFLAFIQQGVSFILYTNAVRVISPFSCAVIGAIEPVLSPFLCFFFLGETPSRFAAAGAVVIIGSVTAWSLSNFAPDDKAENEKTSF